MNDIDKVIKEQGPSLPGYKGFTTCDPFADAMVKLLIAHECKAKKVIMEYQNGDHLSKHAVVHFGKDDFTHATDNTGRIWPV